MTNSLSFSLCALAYLYLSWLAATTWRDKVAGSGIIGAFAAQALWAGTFAALQYGFQIPVSVVVAIDIARSAFWCVFIARCLAPVLEGQLPVSVLRLIYLFTIGLPVAALLAPVWSDNAGDGALFGLQRWSGLLLSILGLVLVEQFARNARIELRWELRYLWLGIGVIFTNDLALWSISLLTGWTNSATEGVRGVVNASVAVLLGVSLRRLRSPIGARLLRQSGALFFNTTLVVAGLYVLLMAAASLLSRRSSDESHSFIEALFVGASLVVLAVALFSSQVRAWSRVILAKYLLPYRYDYRDVWQTLTRDLSAASDAPVRTRVAMSLASFVNSGRARIWERDGDVYRIADPALPEEQQAVVAHGDFFEFMRTREWVFDVAEWREARRQAGSGGTEYAHAVGPTDWIQGYPDAWLLVPLLCNNDLVGFAAIDRPLAPTELGWEQLDLLRAAGRQIGSYIAFDRAAARLGEMHQFEALNRLSGFVMHDLRHLVAQLALVVDNASKHRSNPAFIDDAILTVESSVKRMTGLMEVLKTGAVGEPERRIELGELLREVVSRCLGRQPKPVLDIQGGPSEVMAQRDRLAQALEHLVRNAQDATAESGRVSLALRRVPRGCGIEIADTGCGMDPEFIRTRLFKPFDSTKGQQGMGLGAYEAREIIRKLGGTLTVESTVGVGTVFRIFLPPAPNATV